MDKEKSMQEDHSVHGYNKRLSTEELKHLLCTNSENTHGDTYLTISCELENRRKQNNNDISE